MAQAEAETLPQLRQTPPCAASGSGWLTRTAAGWPAWWPDLIETTGPEAGNLWSRIMYERAEGLPQGSDADQLDRMLAGQLDAALVSSGAAVRWFLNGDPRHFKAAEAWRLKYPKTTNGGINFFNMTCVTMDARTPNRGAGPDLRKLPVQQARPGGHHRFLVRVSRRDVYRTPILIYWASTTLSGRICTPSSSTSISARPGR